jgi:iron complex outermembrane recepter protein
MKQFLLILASWLTYCVCPAQDLMNISGKIVDQRSEPIAGASILVLNAQVGTVSDSTGHFQIAKIPSGKYRLHISAVGFASIEKEISASDQKAASLVLILYDAATHLDAVMVTAEKREELMQQVPASISSLSAKQVTEYRLWNSKDLTAIVPNLYSANPGDQRNVTSIRGITSTSYDPAVATYVDGVNQFTLDTYIAQLFDVERIEVLRGPQGTLYGRNAMGGVINIITKPPTNLTEGFAELSIGNYGMQRISAGIRTALVQDKLFLGVAAMYEHLDGYYDNQFNQSKFDKQHGFSGNYYLKYLASHKWSLMLNVKQQLNRNNGVFPLASSSADAFANPYQVDQNAITQMVDNTLNASFSAIYSGNTFNFTSQTAYQSNLRYYQDPIDADFSPIDGITIINNYGKPWNKVKAWTQEFKFTSPANSISPLRWTAGAYFFYQDNPNKQATRFGKDAALVGSPDSLFSIINTTKSKRLGMAFYAQANYSIGKKLSVIAGMRYDYESDKQEILGQYQKDPDPNPIFDTQPDTTGKTSFNAFSPKLGLTYQLDRNSNLYITYSRGYRVGGLTPLSSDPSQPPLYPYKPEYSNNIEIGSKNSFLNNSLRLNLALFYSRITNAQVPSLILPDAITIIKNAGQLSSEGGELELAATLIRGLEANYNFGYTHATYDALSLSQNGGSTDLSGKRQIFTPDVTSMLALQYSIPLEKKSSLQLVIRGEWMYLGNQYFDLANSIQQSPYSLLNTRIGISAKHWGFYLWGRNLADKTYISYAYDFGAVHLGNPRTVGVTLTAKL